ncbi:cytochrome P450 [Saccharopolyspora sp. NFXS83]|uniref:cytochrome P450 family protein n=1 Tax=Saccharopolyspora sp. NFXS83 TaxID=2993560 RepID=UPI00224A6BE6|nr:cytochrome P450 [Saccharopolyspora sp. NFXS83]MCX2733355.1 cytochrome P450 [Saccharopolyspora sp. NFXS83]
MPATTDNSGLPVLDDAFMQDPYVKYARLRAEAPARRVLSRAGIPVWVVTRYAEARQALSHPGLSKGVEGIKKAIDSQVAPGAHRVEYVDDLQSHLLNTDPPDHTRLRKLVLKGFTPRRVEDLRPRIEEITAGLIDGLAGTSEVELLDQFAFPLPITVISEMLGVEEDRHDDFKQWTTALINGVDADSVNSAGRSIGEYIAELVARKRVAPGDDLISALIEVADGEDRLTEPELISMVFLLLVAGHETTVNLIGNCVYDLLRNPERLAEVRADPNLVDDAIEETLRHESPVNLATMRYTAEAVQLGEVELPAGELVLVALGSANRDERRFERAAEFDPARSATGHLGFGHGIHFCLGASLARLEARIAVRRLLERFPDLSLAVDPAELRWRPSTLVHGLENLPIRLK